MPRSGVDDEIFQRRGGFRFAGHGVPARHVDVRVAEDLRDRRQDPAGAQNVLKVLGETSSNVKPRKDKIDLSKTYTTQFVDAAKSQLG
jgi:hypothetical protein